MIDLGMHERPYIELPARGHPIWPGGKWARLTNMTVSYGHGIAVTPLHLASAYAAMVNGGIWRPARSEEHTSELQSLMRISYAVFCLKKKQLTDHDLSSNTLQDNRIHHE